MKIKSQIGNLDVKFRSRILADMYNKNVEPTELFLSSQVRFPELCSVSIMATEYGVISPPKFNFCILCLFHISSLILSVRHSNSQFYIRVSQFYIRVLQFYIRVSVYDITLGSATAHSSCNTQHAFYVHLIITGLPYGNPSWKVGFAFLRCYFFFSSMSVKVLPVTPLVSGVFVNRAFCAYFLRIERVVELRRFLWWTQ